MSRARRAGRRARGAFAALAVALVLGAAAAAQEAATARRGPKLHREERALAERLYARLEAERAARHDRALLELAFELVDRYRAFPENDRVLLDAAGAAGRLGDRPLARQLLAELRDGWPDSPLLGDAGALGAQIDPPGPSPAAPPAAPPPAPVAPAPPPASPAPRPAVLPSEFAPVTGPAPPPGTRSAAAAPVDPGLLGLLSPLSGGDAAAGAAFGAGAELAIAHAARDGWRRVRLRVADTGGRPALAAVAARRLAAGEGVVALVGPLGAATTAPAAVVADAWRVPLVAPAAASPELRDFSPAVVAIDLVERHDARVLARLAVTVLRRPRGAVLYPDTPEGARACAAYVAALVECGGRLVATAGCATDGAGAAGAVAQLGAARPEAVYLPFAPTPPPGLAAQVVAALPGALLLGPSAWDEAPAAALADPALAGAVFPCTAAVWPAAWEEAFRAGWPGVSGGGRDEPAAIRIAWRGYVAVRLVVEAMADCGLTPARDTLAAALRARWERLGDAAVSVADARRDGRRLRGGIAVPFETAEAAAADR